VKAHPNENWARELMELFSLGDGNYTETDIKESARAFTGWSRREKPLHVSTATTTISARRASWATPATSTGTCASTSS
jgi:uncharacterized protein (DUF1800 family)